MPESVLITRFAGEHFRLNSISEARQAQVLTALGRLTVFLDGTPIEQATDTQLRAWLVAMLDNGLAPSTVGWYLKMVLPFYRWCWLTRVLSADDFLRLREVSPPRGHNTSLPRPYTRTELTRFWEELEHRWPHCRETYLRRYRNGSSRYTKIKRHTMRLQLDAIIELALVCGLRQSEIYRLSIDDVHWDNKYITVAGKRVDQNLKARDVPYPDSTRDAIKAWCRHRGFLGASTPSLWLSVTGTDPIAPLLPTRMEYILRSFGHWQLHRLRHTCATERLRAGMPLESLQRFLGHANHAQTLRYAQLIRSDVHKASERIDADFQAAIRPHLPPPPAPEEEKAPEEEAA